MIIISGEITWESVAQTINSLYESTLGIKDVKKVVIPILSPGGDTDAAWSLYAVLKNLDKAVEVLEKVLKR